MIRFRLGSIPVEVHFLHLVMSLLIAMMATQSAKGPGWPGQAMADSPSETTAMLVVLWMVLVTFSVLVHELGHALVSRAFGYRPSIHLVSLGGQTHPNANETIPWHKDVLLTLAGPAFGGALSLLSFALFLLLDTPGFSSPLTYLLQSMAWVNFAWTVLNLLPVPPLDGGRIALAVGQRVFGRRGFLLTQLLALAISLPLIAWGLSRGDPWLVFLFGMYVVQAFGAIAAYRRGELPREGPSHPFELALAEAEKQLVAREYRKARDLGEALLKYELQPNLRSRVHHLLGWVALKEGEGQRSLDHFAQVEGQPVSPAALAGAFSLVGDDGRALPYWEQAAAGGDPTVRHEWAGTLLRLGREAEVKAIPDVKSALAWSAAQRIHFLRGEFGKAGHAAESAFRADPRPDVAYDAACSYALARDADSALRMLQLASQNGFARADVARTDGDLSFLQSHPQFQAWLASLQKVPRA